MSDSRSCEDNWVDVEAIRRHMARTAEEKLRWLEEAALFYEKCMPPESKRVWEQLKQQGW